MYTQYLLIVHDTTLLKGLISCGFADVVKKENITHTIIFTPSVWGVSENLSEHQDITYKKQPGISPRLDSYSPTIEPHVSAPTMPSGDSLLSV